MRDLLLLINGEDTFGGGSSRRLPPAPYEAGGRSQVQPPPEPAHMENSCRFIPRGRHVRERLAENSRGFIPAGAAPQGHQTTTTTVSPTRAMMSGGLLGVLLLTGRLLWGCVSSTPRKSVWRVAAYLLTGRNEGTPAGSL